MGKKVSKIIPKEVKPALPFVAAYFGGPALGAKMFGVGPAALTSTQAAIAKGLTASLASKIQGDDTKAALRSGLFAATPDLVSGGLGKFEQAYGFKPADVKALSSASQLTKATPIQELASIAGKGKQAIEGAGFLKTVGGQTALEAGARAVELNEKALRDYEAQLREQGIMDSSERRNKIFGYFTRAGYGVEETNAMLDKYGYADGGRVGYKNGRSVSGRVPPFQLTPPDKISQFDLTEGFNRSNKKTAKNDEDEDDEITREEIASYLKEVIDEDDESKTYKRLGSLQSGLEGIMSGYQLATGQPLMGSKPQPTRFGLAEGGIPNVMAMRKTIAELIASGVIDEEDVEEAVAQIRNQAMMSMRAPGMAEGGMMNLGAGGMPAEMDMRGGGFIPIGAKERADDVPARLSKNEFVMTADAVRAAGGGSINKGAKRMYDLMNKLESKV